MLNSASAQNLSLKKRVLVSLVANKTTKMDPEVQWGESVDTLELPELPLPPLPSTDAPQRDTHNSSPIAGERESEVKFSESGLDADSRGHATVDSVITDDDVDAFHAHGRESPLPNSCSDVCDSEEPNAAPSSAPSMRSVSNVDVQYVDSPGSPSASAHEERFSEQPSKSKQKSVRLAALLSANTAFQNVYENVVEREKQRNAIQQPMEVEYVDSEGQVCRMRSLVRMEKLRQTGRHHSGCSSWWHRLKWRLLAIADWVFPLSYSVRQIEGLLGSGVGSLFGFSQFLIHLNLAVFMFWLCLCIIPWFVHPPSFWKPSDLSEYLTLVGWSSGDTIWVFYGGYIPTAGPYNMGAGYSTAIIASFLVAFLMIIMTLRQHVLRDTSTNALIKHDKNFTFATLMFGCWDFKLQNRATATQLRRGLVNTLRERMEELRVRHDLSAKRGFCARMALWSRRFVGFMMFLAVFAICVSAIVILAINQKTLNATFAYTVAFIVSFINLCVPPLVETIVEFERWVDTKIIVRNNVGRVYFIKMVNIVLLLVAVQQLDSASKLDDSDCVETDAARMFWQLLLVDFIVSALSTIVFNFGAKWYTGKLVEVNFATSVNELIYRQAMVMVGQCVSPMMPLLGAVLNVFLFWICKWTYMVTARPPERAWGLSSTSSFFLSFLCMTLFLTSLPTVWFLQRDSSKVCGPHTENETPWSAIPTQLTYAPTAVNEIISWIASPLVLGAGVLVLLVVLYFKQASVRRVCFVRYLIVLNNASHFSDC
jgi:hypothetical protein